MTDASAASNAADAAPFRALLQRLDADGIGYEALRVRLIRFFRLHVPIEAEDLADVALDRLARKLHNGVEIASLPLYALGIARMIVHEAHARGARRRLAEADPSFASEADDDADDDGAEVEAVHAALSACLDSAGAPSRELILEYYGADGAARIATRQRLAAARGISLNALRNRALRLRDALEDCVRKRLHREDAP